MLERASMFLIYVIMIVIGTGLALFLMFIGTFFSGAEADVSDLTGAEHLGADGVDGVDGVDVVGHSGGDIVLGLLKFISPSFLSLLIAVTGAFGLIYLSFGIPPGLTTPLSLVSAFLTSWLLTRAIYKVIRSSPSVKSIRRFEGMEGTVTVTIGPRDQIGEVEVLAEGKRYTFVARSLDGSKIEKGTPVTIVRATTTGLTVKPIEDTPHGRRGRRRGRVRD